MTKRASEMTLEQIENGDGFGQSEIYIEDGTRINILGESADIPNMYGNVFDAETPNGLRLRVTSRNGHIYLRDVLR